MTFVGQRVLHLIRCAVHATPTSVDDHEIVLPGAFREHLRRSLEGQARWPGTGRGYGGSTTRTKRARRSPSLRYEYSVSLGNRAESPSSSRWSASGSAKVKTP